MIRKIIATSASWVPLPLRLGLGVVFIAHGLQKVLGSFGGPGLTQMMTFPAPYSFMRPSWLWMAMAAFGELIGGIFVLLGLFTRVGAFLLLVVMLTAVLGVHWPAFFAPGGIEYPLSLLAMSLALLISGGGIASVDLAIYGGRRR